MPLIYDGPGERFVPIQAPVGISNQSRWVVLTRYTPINQIDIRARGVLFVFRNFTALPLADFFAYTEVRHFNDRNGNIITWTPSSSDLVSLVPYYDFDRIEIFTEGSGLA